MLTVTATDAWRQTYSGAIIGLLELSGIPNNQQASERLNAQKRDLEARLRARYRGFTRQDFLALPGLSDYVRYYKRFSKTYHVQLQLESLVLKGKDLPDVSPLVDSNFMAEIETLVLTAGHDVSRLLTPVSIDLSHAGDEMTQMNGAGKQIPAGDMLMRDAQGICCTILYGQDNRSPITSATSHVLYVAYAPPGVQAEAVESQLQKIEQYVQLVAPGAVREQCRLLLAK